VQAPAQQPIKKIGVKQRRTNSCQNQGPDGQTPPVESSVAATSDSDKRVISPIHSAPDCVQNCLLRRALIQGGDGAQHERPTGATLYKNRPIEQVRRQLCLNQSLRPRILALQTPMPSDTQASHLPDEIRVDSL
jgi:hypothetical protein